MGKKTRSCTPRVKYGLALGRELIVFEDVLILSGRWQEVFYVLFRQRHVMVWGVAEAVHQDPETASA